MNGIPKRQTQDSSSSGYELDSSDEQEFDLNQCLPTVTMTKDVSKAETNALTQSI